MTEHSQRPETDVPPDETPAAICQYCDRPFRSDRLHWLHIGEVHEAAMTDEDRAAYETALEAERDDLFYYQLKVTVALGLLYSTTAMAMMFFLGG